MSKQQTDTPSKPSKSQPTDSRLDRKQHRHSLQPKSATEIPPTALRHTQSHRYDSKGRKNNKRQTTQISSIMEAENSEEEIEKGVELRTEKTKFASVLYENERPSKTSKSKKSEANNKSALAFDNVAFDGNTNSKRSSNATIRTGSSRAPSIQSLEVVREQYCCCAKRTKCERTLLITVTVLSIVIIVLVIVVAILARNNDLEELKKKYLNL